MPLPVLEGETGQDCTPHRAPWPSDTEADNRAASRPDSPGGKPLRRFSHPTEKCSIRQRQNPSHRLQLQQHEPAHDAG